MGGDADRERAPGIEGDGVENGLSDFQKGRVVRRVNADHADEVYQVQREGLNFSGE